MAEEAFPFDNSPAATEEQWSRMMRTVGADGVDGVPSGTALRVTAGSGLGVVVAAGVAWMRGISYRITGTKAFNLDSNTSTTQARIDKIVVRVNFGTNSAVAMAIKGTPAQNPVAPAITYTDTIFDLPLADVRVEANDTISSIADRRLFVGRPVVYCTSQNRPPTRGRPMVAYETDLDRMIYSGGDDQWTVGLGSSLYRPVYVYNGNAGSITAASSWVNELAGAIVSLQITAPPSGRVMFEYGAYLQNNTNNAYSDVALRVTAADGSQYFAIRNDDDNRADRYIRWKNAGDSGGGGAASLSQKAYADSLQPGVQYTAMLFYRVSTGELTADSRYIEAQPIP